MRLEISNFGPEKFLFDGITNMILSLFPFTFQRISANAATRQIYLRSSFLRSFSFEVLEI